MGRRGLIVEYYEWLLSLVIPDDDVKKKYSKVLELMFDTEFQWVVYNDDNRAADGLDLRYRYSDMHGGVWSNWFSMAPCSMLEMMVALSVRCEEEIMHDDNYGDRTHEWFWHMMKNSGLINQDNKRFYSTKAKIILAGINERKYRKDGKGGLFCVKNADEDFRMTELWYQLGYYLRENFEF